MSKPRFPFLKDILKEKSATLYVLCDDPLRTRDTMAALSLVNFCAARGVRLDVIPVLADHRRYISADDMVEALQLLDAATISELWDVDLEVAARVKQLFERVEVIRKESIPRDHPLRTPRLAAHGPIIVLARLKLYPEEFREQIHKELAAVGRAEEDRFTMDPPGVDSFWNVRDTFLNTGYGGNWTCDYAVVRKVRGEFRRRSFLFLAGTTSLGTYGVTHLITNGDLNERLEHLGIDAHLRDHGAAELLVKVEPAPILFKQPSGGGVLPGHLTEVGWREWRPDEFAIVAEPTAPVSALTQQWIERFTNYGGGVS